MKTASLLLLLMLSLLTVLPLAAQGTYGYVEDDATPAYACANETCERLTLLPSGAGVRVIGSVVGSELNGSPVWYEVLLDCPCFDYERRSLSKVPDTDYRSGNSISWYQLHPVWSPDSTRIAAVVADGLFVWDAGSGDLLIHEPLGLKHPSRIMSWSPDGTQIVAGSNSFGIEGPTRGGPVHSLLVLNADGSDPHPLPDQTGDVINLAWSPDGTRIATAGERLRVWDAERGDLLLDLDIYATDVAWSPDGRRIALVKLSVEQESSSLQLRDAAGGVLLSSLGPVDRLYFVNVTWLPNGSHIVSLALVTERQNGDGIRTTGSVVLSWDGSNDNDSVALLYVTDDEITNLDWSPDGRFFVSPVQGGVSLLEAIDPFGQTFGRSVAELLPVTSRSIKGFTAEDPYFIENVAWSPDGQRIVATGIKLNNKLDGGEMSALVWDLTLTPAGPTPAFIHVYDFVDFE